MPKPVDFAIQRFPVAKLDFSSRARRDLGDLQELAASISNIGLLHLPVVTPEGRVLAGGRRVAACKLLGWEELECHVLLDGAAERPLDVERDENVVRKDLAPSEAVALVEAIEEKERDDAERRKKEGQKSGGRGRKKLAGKLPASFKGDTRDAVAAAVGMSGRTYEKAKAVLKAAEENPGYADLVERMDRTGNVDAAHRALTQREKAAREQPIASTDSNTDTFNEDKEAQHLAALLRTLRKEFLVFEDRVEDAMAAIRSFAETSERSPKYHGLCRTLDTIIGVADRIRGKAMNR